MVSCVIFLSRGEISSSMAFVSMMSHHGISFIIWNSFIASFFKESFDKMIKHIYYSISLEMDKAFLEFSYCLLSNAYRRYLSV